MKRFFRYHPPPYLGLCIGFALILLGLSSCAPAKAQLPVPPVSLTVAVNTNGVLLAPANFFSVNSNAFRAVVTNTTGFLIATNNPIGWSTNHFAVSGTNVALAPTLYWTNLLEFNGSSNGVTRINEFRVEDVSAFRVANSTDSEVNAEVSLTLQSGGDLTLQAETNLYLSTPGLLGLSAQTNSVLTLLDPTTGRAEWRPVEQLFLTTQTAGKVVSLGTTKRLESTGVDASALATLTTNVAAGWLNPRMYGMTGDGTTDDSAAFAAWSAAITNGQRWLFPAGTYRIATAGQAILRRTNLANVHIAAAPGARFLMDNSAGTEGTSHGVAVFGPSTNVVLDGLHLEWVQQSTNRTVSANWMGFILYNQLLYSTTNIEPQMLRNVTVRNCSVTRSPGLGFCLAGVDGAVFEGNVYRGGLVDGIYIRTSRRIQAVNNAVYGAGDDGFSIATYEFDRATASIDAPYHGEGSVIEGLIIEGPVNTNGLSAPAGVFIGGVRDVVYNGVLVRNYDQGVRLNCGYDDVAMASGGYSVLAPQNVLFANAAFHNVGSAITLQLSTNSLYSAGNDPKWWRGQATIDGLRITGETPTRLFTSQMWRGTTRGLESAPAKYLWHGLTVRNVSHSGSRGTYGGVNGLSNSVLANITTENRLPIAGFQVSPFGTPVDDLPRNDLVADNVQAAEILVQGVNGATFNNLRAYHSPGFGVAFVHSRDLYVGSLHVENAQQTPEGSPALLISGVKNVTIDLAVFKQTNSIGIAIQDTNNVATHLNRYFWFGNQHFSDLSGARIFDITATRLGIREVNWYNANEPGSPQWYQMRMDSRLGVNRIPDSRFRLDVAGNARLQGSFANLTMDDSGQNYTNGGLARLIGDTSYNGGYAFQFNTATDRANEFGSATVLMRLLRSNPAVSPGSPAAVDLGGTDLAWRTAYADTVMLTSSNTNRFELGVDTPTDAYLYDHAAARRVWDTQSSQFNVYRTLTVNPSGTNVLFQADAGAATNETPAILLINGSTRRVVVGAADSAGTGFRLLRVAN